MGRSKVTFNIKKGGIARLSENKDNVSALVFYTVTNILPASGFTTANWAKFTSIAEVENIGVTSTSTGVLLESWYQANQFFDKAPNSELWIAYFSGTTYNFEEILQLQIAAGSQIRRFGVSTYSRGFSTTDLNALQTVKETLDSNYQNATIFYAPNVAGTLFTGTTQVDLRSGTFTNDGVLTLIGSDATDAGSVNAAIALANSATCSQMGAAVGMKSANIINVCIGQVSNGNMSDGVENEKLKVGAVNYNSTSGTIIDDLTDKGYVFLLKYNDVPGSYFNSDFNAINKTDDINRISIRETVDKVVRETYKQLALFLNTTVDIDPTTGRIDYATIKIWENAAGTPLEVMVAQNELTSYVVYIDPAQNVVSSSEVKVIINISIFGIAQDITVDLSLAANV